MLWWPDSCFFPKLFKVSCKDRVSCAEIVCEGCYRRKGFGEMLLLAVAKQVVVVMGLGKWIGL